MSGHRVKLSMKCSLLMAEEGDGGPDHFALKKFVPTKMKRRGIEMKMALESGANASRGRTQQKRLTSPDRFGRFLAATAAGDVLRVRA
jgi:hypothetical protein